MVAVAKGLVCPVTHSHGTVHIIRKSGASQQHNYAERQGKYNCSIPSPVSLTIFEGQNSWKAENLSSQFSCFYIIGMKLNLTFSLDASMGVILLAFRPVAVH